MLKHLCLLLCLTTLPPATVFADNTDATRPLDSAFGKPNLIVVLCDDLGQGDPGCYNPRSKIPMPSVDMLAA